MMHCKKEIPINGAMLSEIGGSATVFLANGVVLVTSAVIRQIALPGYIEIETKNSIYKKTN